MLSHGAQNYAAPYDGIIRIRYKGQGDVYPNLSAISPALPRVLFDIILYPLRDFVKRIIINYDPTLNKQVDNGAVFEYDNLVELSNRKRYQRSKR